MTHIDLCFKLFELSLKHHEIVGKITLQNFTTVDLSTITDSQKAVSKYAAMLTYYNKTRPKGLMLTPLDILMHYNGNII